MEAASIPSGERSILERSPLARLPDRALKYGLTALAALILALIVYFFIRLVGEARPAFAKEGVLGFVFGNDWNVSAEHFGALPLLVGTLITSALALLIGVPVAVAAAVYATELCPLRLRSAADDARRAARRGAVGRLRPVGHLLPRARSCSRAEQWVADRLSFIPFIGGGLVTIPNYFITGLVLAIMILPIVSAISREVMATVPADHKEAALGLGATRWEMIRIAVLPYCRSGIVGGAMLGLGRAIGETIAVTILIGDAPQLGHHLFEQGYSLAAVIANEFGEAQGLHRSALFAAGLVLFVLTLLVNALARLIVIRAARTRSSGPAADAPARRGGILARGRGGGRMSAHDAQPAERLARFAVSPARRRKDRLARGMILAGTVIALIPLVLIVYYLLRKGLGAWSVELLHDRPDRQHVLRRLEHRRHQERDPRHDRDRRAGLGDRDPDRRSASRSGWSSTAATAGSRSTVRFFVDVLTGVPSIVFGLFVYIVLIVGTGSTYAGYKGSIALSLLMLPIVIRSAEVILLLVPAALRESALALGAPRWRVIFSVVLPTALPGMLTGVLLAVARAAGETAPLLFTAAATHEDDASTSAAS